MRPPRRCPITLLALAASALFPCPLRLEMRALPVLSEFRATCPPMFMVDNM